ncbi:MAG TPA: mevalonate kinase [Candidatus Poseidoniia archaeon]|nr:mevalonate kinase [Candidatus Poseidoniia archaeon]
MDGRFTAPGKIILFGEHAVVYGKPAIAIPVSGMRASAWSETGEKGLTINALDLGEKFKLKDSNNQFTVLAQAILARTNQNEPNLTINLSSKLPQGSGMGSSAATSTAVCRALSGHFGVNLAENEVSELVFNAEKVVHGTPSGIDNTVVAYEMPVYFVKGEKPETFEPGKKFFLVIGDTGIEASTKETVSSVRNNWKKEPALMNGYFDEIERITKQGKMAIENGNRKMVGEMMNKNHKLLNSIGVGHEELEKLVDISKEAGALGAKLTGGGGGGNMVALAENKTSQKKIHDAITEAGYRAYQTSFGEE